MNELTAERMQTLKDNYSLICENIAAAAERSGRKAGDIELVAVTKTVPLIDINYAIELGVRHIGENRVQELASKYDGLILRDDLTVSVIGHLQTNKAKPAVEMADMIQSVDSLHLAEEISKKAQLSGKVMPCLVEINIGNEVTKSGIPIEQAEDLVCAAAALDGIEIHGLMTIPPFDADENKLRDFFEKIRKIYVDITTKYCHNNSIRMKYLSMGMSSDYEAAIECGSNMVRIGTALFGTRNYNKQ